MQYRGVSHVAGGSGLWGRYQQGGPQLLRVHIPDPGTSHHVSVWNEDTMDWNGAF